MDDKVKAAIDYFTEYVKTAKLLAEPLGGEPAEAGHYRTILAELTRLQTECGRQVRHMSTIEKAIGYFAGYLDEEEEVRQRTDIGVSDKTEVYRTAVAALLLQHAQGKNPE